MRTSAKIVLSRARKDSFCHIVQFPALGLILPLAAAHRTGLSTATWNFCTFDLPGAGVIRSRVMA
jgi:hypothetical protein